MNNTMSIHPRVENGRQRHEKANTSKPHKGKGKLARKMAELSRRRLAHSATLKSIPIGAAMGYKTPGSMNQHK